MAWANRPRPGHGAGRVFRGPGTRPCFLRPAGDDPFRRFHRLPASGVLVLREFFDPGPRYFSNRAIGCAARDPHWPALAVGAQLSRLRPGPGLVCEWHSRWTAVWSLFLPCLERTKQTPGTG